MRLVAGSHQADCSLVDRIWLLERLVAGKNVVHVGCVDHSAALIERKISHGTWLHGHLNRVAERCMGIDIDADAIEYIKQTLKIGEVFCCDLTRQALPVMLEKPWDFLLLGEVVEHVDNPVAFLSALRERHFPHAAQRLIVTVPNALKESNYRTSKAGREKINSDHRFWFTPFTIAKVLSRSGFQIEDIYLVNSKPRKPKASFKAWRKRRLQRQHPLLRDNIVVTASI